jgi:hypothetical protein
MPDPSFHTARHFHGTPGGGPPTPDPVAAADLPAA